MQHFRSFWSWTYVATIIVTTMVCIMDFVDTDISTKRPYCAIAIILNWLRFFYLLRLFKATQSLIRIMIEVFTDMAYFIIILFVTFLAFSNSFYILGLNTESDLRAQEIAEGLEIGELTPFAG